MDESAQDPARARKLVHLDFPAIGPRWPSQLLARAGASLKASDQKSLNEAGLAIVSRDHLLDLASQKLVEGVKTVEGQVRKQVENGSRDSTEPLEGLRGGTAYRTSPPVLAFDLALATDTFLFEAQSWLDLVQSFVIKFHRSIFRRKFSRADFRRELSSRGVDFKAIDVLGRARDFFTHESAPWLAFEVERERPLELRLVIMKENLGERTEPGKVVHGDELDAAIRAMQFLGKAVETFLEDELS